MAGTSSACSREPLGSRLTLAASRAFCACGVDALFRAINRRKVLVVAYHGLVTNALDPSCPWMVTDTEFERQMTWLARRYRIVRLGELADRLHAGDPLPARSAVVTFDDGYASVVDLALPILRRLRLPATAFLVTSAVGSDDLLWHDRLYVALARSRADWLDLGEEGGSRHALGSPGRTIAALDAVAAFLKTLPVPEKAEVLSSVLRQLGAAPDSRPEDHPFAAMADAAVDEAIGSGWIDIGSHGHHHEVLTRLDPSARDREVHESMAWLRHRLGGTPVAFAYPNGLERDFDDALAHAVRGAGFTSAVTAIGGLNAAGTDRFAIRRIVVESGLPLSRFRLRTSGFAAWAHASLHLATRAGRWRARMRPLRRLAREMLLKRQALLVFERPPAGPESAANRDRAATIEPRGRGLSFGPPSRASLAALAARLTDRDPARFLDDACRRLDDGKRGYAIMRGDRVVSIVWVDEGPRVFVPEIEATLDLGAGALYLYDALTLPEWRGRGLFPSLLQQVGTAHPAARLVTAVSRTNASSRRGIEKAGFALVEERRLLKVAGVVLRATTRPALAP